MVIGTKICDSVDVTFGVLPATQKTPPFTQKTPPFTLGADGRLWHPAGDWFWRSASTSQQLTLVQLGSVCCINTIYYYNLLLTFHTDNWDTANSPHSHSRTIVTMAVSLNILDIFSVIFSVKEWPDLEICVWGRSRSLKMARFDKSCITFYCSAIVTIIIIIIMYIFLSHHRS